MPTHTLQLPLFLTRVSIFLFMLPWQIIRFTKPDVINNISNKYYKFSMPEIGSTISGVLMIALLLAFLIGFKKNVSYLLVLLLHGVGTIMTIPFLIPGSESFNILFLAAIPAIGAMLLLYCLRNEDTMLSVG
jgi:peptidoglycan/LPS O-acetylase OafA/YrhL